MEKLGIESQILSSGKDKTILDPFSDLSDYHKIHLKKLLKSIHNQFISDITDSRGTRISSDVFTGLFWTGIEATKIGLVDEILSIYDVTEKYFNDTQLIVYNKEDDLLKELFKSSITFPNNIIGIKY